jgi:hypothetical protein
MTFDNFNKYLRDKCNYETIYADGEGRVILVITLLDAYTMTHRAPKEWISLTDEDLFKTLQDASDGEAKRLPGGFRLFAKEVENLLKEKNCG